eukprot:NODE_1170_length_1910_cov_0.589729.p3 type:complete len:110 gc:universal NODE_1170_length_1910_cov_0.589729:840-1169(+)
MSDSSDEDLIIIKYLHSKQQKPKRQPRTHYHPIVKIRDWFEVNVPQLSESRYKYFFRMTKSHYEYFKQTILNSGSPYLENLNIGKLHILLETTRTLQKLVIDLTFQQEV